jgi:hypothetical protein
MYRSSINDEVKSSRSNPMSYLYQAVVMLPTENQPTLDRIKDRLQKVFERVDPIACIRINLDRLIIAIDDWQMNIYPQSSPDTIAASQNIADLYLEADDPQKSELANYGLHIEVSCHPDPQMDRFKYYVCVLDALADFPGAIVFNPSTKGFIEQSI